MASSSAIRSTGTCQTSAAGIRNPRLSRVMTVSSTAGADRPIWCPKGRGFWVRPASVCSASIIACMPVPFSAIGSRIDPDCRISGDGMAPVASNAARSPLISKARGTAAPSSADHSASEASLAVSKGNANQASSAAGSPLMRIGSPRRKSPINRACIRARTIGEAGFSTVLPSVRVFGFSIDNVLITKK